MKRHYEKMCITLHEFNLEGSLLQTSVITEKSAIQSMGHEIGNTFDGTPAGGGEFNLDWE